MAAWPEPRTHDVGYMIASLSPISYYNANRSAGYLSASENPYITVGYSPRVRTRLYVYAGKIFSCRQKIDD